MSNIFERVCSCGCGESITLENKSGYRPGHFRKRPIEYLVEDRGYLTPCWICVYVPQSAGYGLVTRNGKRKLAHVAMYEERFGPVPLGKELDHLCRIRNCMNPGHVEPVTQAENTIRGKSGKLSRDDVIEIRTCGDTNRAVAHRFGISETYVSNLRAGRFRRDGFVREVH